MQLALQFIHLLFTVPYQKWSQKRVAVKNSFLRKETGQNSIRFGKLHKTWTENQWQESESDKHTISAVKLYMYRKSHNGTLSAMD